jgi:hypothetical protein
MLDHYESHDAEYRAMRDASGFRAAHSGGAYTTTARRIRDARALRTDGDADDAADEADADRRAYFDLKGE